VGVNHYDKRGFRDLEYAERDVEELARVLDRAGYEIHLLTGSAAGEKRATLKNVLAAIEATLKERTKRDLVLVCLAGHGLQIEIPVDGKLQAESFFCPADAAHGDPQTMLAMGALFDQINRRGGGQNLVLIDACREDPTRGRGMDGSTVRTLPEGVAALFGCRAGQKTFESKNAGGGHGVFFHFVIEGLRRGAKNKRDEVTWNGLVEYVTQQVTERTGSLLGDPAIEQKPNLIANLPDRVIILPPKERAAASPGTGPAKATMGVRVWTTLYRPDGVHGVEVDQVWPEGPARDAGVKRGDLILAIDRRAVGTCEEFNKRIEGMPPETTVAVELFRDARRQSIELELVAAEDIAGRLQKAAAAGDAEAQFALAFAHREGMGLRQSDSEYIAWMRKAANAGYAEAQEKLGDAYLFGVGMSNDEGEAVRWYRKAAEQGWARGQHDLGDCYRNGNGVQRDYAEALKLVYAAASQRLLEAEYLMGVIAERGQGVSRDSRVAILWYRRAAERGLSEAQNNLGGMYFNGRGVTKNNAEAAKWFRLAAAQGLQLAQENLRLIEGK
jgi:TPR repeat protein